MTTSLSKSKRYSSSDGQPGSVVWFISFGDLLTLLLCFFLVLTPWERLKKGSNTQSVQAVTGRLDTTAHPGTTFASDHPLRGSVITLELPLFESVGSERPSSAALSDEVAKALPANGRIEVLVCSELADRASVVRYVGEALEGRLGRTVPLRYVVERSCETSNVLAPVTKRVVGRIRIVGT